MEASVAERAEALRARLQEFLRHVLVAAKVSVREAERLAGMSQGTLTRVFNGHVALGLQHILPVLVAIDYPPDRFFELALRPSEAKRHPTDAIAELLEEIEGPRASRPPSVAADLLAGLSADEIKDLFVRTIEEADEKRRRARVDVQKSEAEPAPRRGRTRA